MTRKRDTSTHSIEQSTQKKIQKEHYKSLKGCTKKPSKLKENEESLNIDSNFHIPQKIPYLHAPTNGRTISVALPASIMNLVHSPLLKSCLVSQIARTISIYGVDEIIIYEDLEIDEKESSYSDIKSFIQRLYGDDKNCTIREKNTRWSRALQFFIHNLCYLETPQYLRVLLFNIHPDLKMTGIQNPLGTPHHTRLNDMLPYREGVVISSANGESTIECGLTKPYKIKSELPCKTRHTLRFKTMGKKNSKKYIINKVSRMEPYSNYGLYWGYSVRCAESLQHVFNQCPYALRYDLIIGTSEHGTPVKSKDFHFKHDNFKHCLIVLGGQQGLETILNNPSQSKISSQNINELFNYYLNICEHQTTRTIRTEEALMITLAVLKPILTQNT